MSPSEKEALDKHSFKTKDRERNAPMTAGIVHKARKVRKKNLNSELSGTDVFQVDHTNERFHDLSSLKTSMLKTFEPDQNCKQITF